MALFEEAIEPVKKDFPANYALLMTIPLEKGTHHATPSNLVNQEMTTSNSAEATIAGVGDEVGELTPYTLQKERFSLVLKDSASGCPLAQRQAADVGSRVGLHRSQRFVKSPTVDHCSSEFSLDIPIAISHVSM